MGLGADSVNTRRKGKQSKSLSIHKKKVSKKEATKISGYP